MHLFKKQRTPAELMTKLCAAYEELSRNAAPAQRQAALDHVVKYTGEMRVLLYGEAGEKAAKEDDSRTLCLEASKSALLSHMASPALLAQLAFEARERLRGGKPGARLLRGPAPGCCADAERRGPGVLRARAPVR